MLIGTEAISIAPAKERKKERKKEWKSIEGLAGSVWTPLRMVAPDTEVQRQSEDGQGTPSKGGPLKMMMSFKRSFTVSGMKQRLILYFVRKIT